MNRYGRRIATTLFAVSLAGSVSACASDTLSERDPRTVTSGQVLAPSYTAAVRGSTSHVLVPSGRVNLTLTAPMSEVPAQAVAGARPLRPAAGAKAVGVAWSLDRGAFPNSVNRQVAPPTTVYGVPQPVRLWLVTDGTRREIPSVGTLLAPGDRARTAAWLVVPSGVRQWRFEVAYDGVTQSVDARSGAIVTSGAAAPLYRSQPLNYRGSCEFRGSGSNYSSCSLDFAAGYPYVDGAGWAPAGKTFAVVKVSTEPDTDAGRNVLIAGTRSVALLKDSGRLLRAWVVTPARTYPVTGSAPTENDDGGIVTRPVTGTLATDRTAP